MVESNVQFCWLRGKIPGQVPMMHTIRGGHRALLSNCGIFRGVGIEGGGQSLPKGLSTFGARTWEWSRTLARGKKQRCGRDVVKSGLPLRYIGRLSVAYLGVEGMAQGDAHGSCC